MKKILLLIVLIIFASNTVKAISEYSADDNTLALWHFDEGQGNFAFDDTGKNNGNIFNAKYTNQASPLGNSEYALEFNNSDDYVEVLDGGGLDINENGITLEAYIRISSNCGGTIISKREGSSANYVFGTTQDSNNICRLGYFFSINNGSFFIEVTDPNAKYEIDEFSHVAVTHDFRNGEIIFYKDGIESFRTIKPFIPDINNAPVFIGNQRHPDIPTNFFGIIDEVRISNRVRNQDEFNEVTLKSLAEENIKRQRDIEKLNHEINLLKTEILKIKNIIQSIINCITKGICIFPKY